MVFDLPPVLVYTSPCWPTRKPQERRRPGQARKAQGGAPPPAPLVISSLLLWRTDSDGVPSPFRAVPPVVPSPFQAVPSGVLSPFQAAPPGVPSQTQTILTGASPLPKLEVLESVEPSDASRGGIEDPEEEAEKREAEEGEHSGGDYEDFEGESYERQAATDSAPPHAQGGAPPPHAHGDTGATQSPEVPLSQRPIREETGIKLPQKLVQEEPGAVATVPTPRAGQQRTDTQSATSTAALKVPRPSPGRIEGAMAPPGLRSGPVQGGTGATPVSAASASSRPVQGGTGATLGPAVLSSCAPGSGEEAPLFASTERRLSTQNTPASSTIASLPRTRGELLRVPIWTEKVGVAPEADSVPPSDTPPPTLVGACGGGGGRSEADSVPPSDTPPPTLVGACGGGAGRSPGGVH